MIERYFISYLFFIKKLGNISIAKLIMTQLHLFITNQNIICQGSKNVGELLLQICSKCTQYPLKVKSKRSNCFYLEINEKQKTKVFCMNALCFSVTFSLISRYTFQFISWNYHWEFPEIFDWHLILVDRAHLLLIKSRRKQSLRKKPEI